MMKLTQKILMWAFWLNLAVCALIALVFETHLLESGILEGQPQLLFMMAVVMQMLTICVIPLALKLFKFKFVSRPLTTGSDDERAMQLRKWGIRRLDLLCIPMILNLLFYYMTMVVGFCYMAIILALSLFFVFPGMDRCLRECGLMENESEPNS